MEQKNDEQFHCCGSMEWPILLEPNEAAEFYRGVGAVALFAAAIALVWMLLII